MVLTIAAVLIALVLPSFRRIVQGAVISSTVNSFLADVRFARSEALKRGGNVVLCRSADPEASSPTCTAATPAGGWATGWIVFLDLNGNGSRDPADPVLKVRSAVSGLDTIDDGGAGGPYRFTALGRLLPGAAATELSFGGAKIDPDLRRSVCVLPSGAARLQANGAASCAG